MMKILAIVGKQYRISLARSDGGFAYAVYEFAPSSKALVHGWTAGTSKEAFEEAGVHLNEHLAYKGPTFL